MKNIFNKTAVVMLATGMLCAIFATGCTATENNTASKENKATEVSTQTEESTEGESITPTEAVTEGESTIATENSTAADGLELTQQTLVDEVTGIEVSGMIPADVDLFTTADFFSMADISELEYPYSVDDWFSEFTFLMGEYEAYQADRKVENIQKILNQKGWADWEGTAGGMMDIEVYFLKDSKVVEFESDLTVTMPFNYRRGLVNGGIKDEAVVMHYDYDSMEFLNVEVVSAEATPKGMFQCKIQKPGIFFLGGESNISGLIEFFERGKITLEDLL